MNHKRRHNRKTVIRKQFNPINSVGEWSRMIHKWWIRDVVAKKNFRKELSDAQH